MTVFLHLAGLSVGAVALFLFGAFVGRRSARKEMAVLAYLAERKDNSVDAEKVMDATRVDIHTILDLEAYGLAPARPARSASRPEDMRAELVQVAAVAVAMVEALDRRAKAAELGCQPEELEHPCLQPTARAKAKQLELDFGDLPAGLASLHKWTDNRSAETMYIRITTKGLDRLRNHI